jgi:hypothetical protein
MNSLTDKLEGSIKEHFKRLRNKTEENIMKAENELSTIE